MLTVLAALPAESSVHPPAILIHGAANSAPVWKFWQHELVMRGWPTYAVNLRGLGSSSHISLSHTSMQDYANDVRRLINQLRVPPVLIGWSMGGLVALIVAASDYVSACVCLAPSLPAQQSDVSVMLRTGEFGPEEYGITSDSPDDQPAMPDLDREERLLALTSLGRESRFARDERKRGIVVDALLCPLLIVTGTADQQWPSDVYRGLWLPADYLQFHGASHWGLVLNRRALSQGVPRVLEWLDRIAPRGSCPFL